MDERRGTILIVEDDEDLRFIVTAHLRGAGFDVVEAGDGYAAIQRVQENRIDVIIMDIGLPKMDGIEATRALKSDERTSSIPVIMLTGRSKTKDVVRGLAAGAQEYLAKPFDMAELLARVQTVYRLARAHEDLDCLNSRLEAEVSVKTRRLQILYDFMRDLNRTTTRDNILELMIRGVKLMTNAARISLMLTDANSEFLICERAIGIDPKIVDKIKIGSMRGISGQVLHSGKTLAAKTFGPRTADAARYASDCFLSAPLISTSRANGDSIIGIVNVTDKPNSAPFSEDEIDCIRSMADATAIALDSVLRREQLEQSVTVLLRTVGHLAEYRDEETTLHLERVSVMARILARELAREKRFGETITEEYVDLLVQAAPMHDIGKVGIPDDILLKPGKLTDEEFQIMKTHTDIGRRVLSQAFDENHPAPLLRMCIDIAYCHHERFNGSGYPRRIAGNEIPLSARIIALVDAFDAITSERRYSKAKPHNVAVDIIRSESGQHFDPVIVEAFLSCHDEFREVRDGYQDTPEAVAATLS